MPENSIFNSLIWFAVLMVPMYFMTIRPQQKEQKARAEMLRNLKPGVKILTQGGLFGVITKVGDNTVKVRVAEQVELQLTRAGIMRVVDD